MSSVLVVDDDADICTLMRMALTSRGHGVETATSAEAALEVLGVRQFDVIVTDLNFDAGMNGEELLDRLHALNASARVILISGFADMGDARRFRERGAFDLLVKPFDLRVLAEVVDRAIAQGDS